MCAFAIKIHPFSPLMIPFPPPPSLLLSTTLHVPMQPVWVIEIPGEPPVTTNCSFLCSSSPFTVAPCHVWQQNTCSTVNFMIWPGHESSKELMCLCPQSNLIRGTTRRNCLLPGKSITLLVFNISFIRSGLVKWTLKEIGESKYCVILVLGVNTRTHKCCPPPVITVQYNWEKKTQDIHEG